MPNVVGQATRDSTRERNRHGSSRPRLLLISYHFPPDPAVGSLRWAKFAEIAVERGWDVDVIAGPDGSNAEPRSAGWGVRVFRPRMQPSRWVDATARGMTRAAGVLRRRKSRATGEASADVTSPAQLTWTTPDQVRWDVTSPLAWVRSYRVLRDFSWEHAWASSAVEAAAGIIEPGVHRAVLTSGPPHLAHDAGRRVAKRYGIPLVMDMRDPWSGTPWIQRDRASPVAIHIARILEAAAIRRSSLIIANTQRARDYLVQKYPQRADDVITVANGSDTEAIPTTTRSDRFIIAHLGTLYLDRTPEPVLRAASLVISELRLSPDKFGLSFVGGEEIGEGESVASMAEAAGIREYVDSRPPVARVEAMQHMADAAMLLILVGAHPSAVPAKTFEYMRFGAWLLALAVKESATADLLAGTTADVVPPADVPAIADVIRLHYLEFTQGIRPDPIAADARFSRRFQADILFESLERVIQSNPVHAENG